MLRQRFSVFSTILTFGLLVSMTGQPVATAETRAEAQPATNPISQADESPEAPVDEPSVGPFSDLELSQGETVQLPSSDSETRDQDLICDDESQKVELSGDCFITNCAASEACYFQYCENGSTGECDQHGCSHLKCFKCYQFCESMC